MKTGMWAVVKQYPWDTGYTIETLKVAQVCRAEVISKHRTWLAASKALKRLSPRDLNYTQLQILGMGF